MNPKTMTTPTQPTVALEALKRILHIAQPERVILFGSWARGEASADSDLDLLVAMPFSGSRAQVTLLLLRALADLPLPKDVIVLTPAEWETKRQLPGTIAYPAEHKGVVLYAA